MSEQDKKINDIVKELGPILETKKAKELLTDWTRNGITGVSYNIDPHIGPAKALIEGVMNDEDYRMQYLTILLLVADKYLASYENMIMIFMRLLSSISLGELIELSRNAEMSLEELASIIDKIGDLRG